MWQVHKVRCCSRFYYPKVHTVQLKVSKVLCTCECDTDKQILLILHFILLMILLYFYVYLSISMCVLAHSLCSGPPDPGQSEPLSLQTGNPPVCLSERLQRLLVVITSPSSHHHCLLSCCQTGRWSPLCWAGLSVSSFLRWVRTRCFMLRDGFERAREMDSGKAGLWGRERERAVVILILQILWVLLL